MPLTFLEPKQSRYIHCNSPLFIHTNSVSYFRQYHSFIILPEKLFSLVPLGLSSKSPLPNLYSCLALSCSQCLLCLVHFSIFPSIFLPSSSGPKVNICSSTSTILIKHTNLFLLSYFYCTPIANPELFPWLLTPVLDKIHDNPERCHYMIRDPVSAELPGYLAVPLWVQLKALFRSLWGLFQTFTIYSSSSLRMEIPSILGNFLCQIPLQPHPQGFALGHQFSFLSSSNLIYSLISAATSGVLSTLIIQDAFKIPDQSTNFLLDSATWFPSFFSPTRQ